SVKSARSATRPTGQRSGPGVAGHHSRRGGSGSVGAEPPRIGGGRYSRAAVGGQRGVEHADRFAHGARCRSEQDAEMRRVRRGELSDGVVLRAVRSWTRGALNVILGEAEDRLSLIR